MLMSFHMVYFMRQTTGREDLSLERIMRSISEVIMRSTVNFGFVCFFFKILWDPDWQTVKYSSTGYGQSLYTQGQA